MAVNNLDLRSNSFEEIGSIYLYVQKELYQKINTTPQVDLCGVTFQNDTVAVLDFSDTVESTYDEIGIYNLPFDEGEEYAVSMVFEVDSTLNYVSPGYNVYHVVQTDSSSGDTVGMFTRTLLTSAN